MVSRGSTRMLNHYINAYWLSAKRSLGYIAQILCNLGELYYEQEQYSQAEPFYQRALAIREQTLGLQHPDTAQNVAYLAKLHQQKHNYAEAKTLYQRALLILEKALGA